MGVAIPTQSDARKIQGKNVTAPTSSDDGKALVFNLLGDKYDHRDARGIRYTNANYPEIQTLADALDLILSGGVIVPPPTTSETTYNDGSTIQYNDGSVV